MSLNLLGNMLIEEIMLCFEGIYVIDDKTKEIIFINDTLSKGKPQNYVGKKCYSALMGRDRPCSFCPKHTDFTPKNNLECYDWEYYNNKKCSWYKIRNRFAVDGDKRYRIGNVTLVQEIMDLAKEAIDEVSDLQETITEYKRLKSALENEARRDYMTKLYNRNQYISDLCQLYPKAKTLGVLFFDINNLKTINDTINHAAGDDLIKRLADAIYIPDNHLYKGYRIGGDEFVIITMNSTQDDLMEIKATVLEKLEKSNQGKTHFCEVAVGSAYSPVPCDPELIVLDADKFMYEHKCLIKGISK